MSCDLRWSQNCGHTPTYRDPEERIGKLVSSCLKGQLCLPQFQKHRLGPRRQHCIVLRPWWSRPWHTPYQLLHVSRGMTVLCSAAVLLAMLAHMLVDASINDYAILSLCTSRPVARLAGVER